VPAPEIEKKLQTSIQTKSSQPQARTGKKRRRKLKRPTGLPVSLEGLQEESHGLAFIRPPILADGRPDLAVSCR
jgi:hypothetical protein